LVERTIQEILRFHKYEYYVREIKNSPCPALDGPGIAIYDPDDTGSVDLQVGPASEFYCDPFEAKQLEIIRRDLPPFLRWYWVGRFYLERDWNLPDPRNWQDYKKGMIDRCLGPNYNDDNLVCHIYIDDDCPCGMCESRFD
jgi:hypothetical protein